MIKHSVQQHTQKIDDWIAEWSSGMPLPDQLKVLATALVAVQVRALRTLSRVSLNAIFERASHEAAVHFPLLSPIDLSQPLSVTTLLACVDKLEEWAAVKAMRFIMVETISILENLTAGILTVSLYREIHRASAALQTSAVLETDCTHEREGT